MLDNGLGPGAQFYGDSQERSVQSPSGQGLTWLIFLKTLQRQTQSPRLMSPQNALILCGKYSKALVELRPPESQPPIMPHVAYAHRKN